MGRTAKGWSLVSRREIQHVRFTWQKKRYEFSTGEGDPGAAASRAAQIYSDVITGKWRPIDAGSSALLIDLLPKWLIALESDLDKETVETYEGYSRRWLKLFGSTLGSIHRASAADYRRVRLLKVGASSVRKELSALRNFLAWCVEQNVLQEAPVIAGVPKRATGTPVRERRPDIIPTVEQVEAIFRALPPRCRGGHVGRGRFIVAYETGLRPETLDTLSVPENFTGVGAVQLWIPNEQDKARFGRPLPLSPRARAVLDEIAPEEGLIFGKHDYRGVWRKAIKAAGLPASVVPYDLRHARIQHLVDAGEPLTGVAYMAGHTLLTTTNNYVRGSRALAEKMVSGVTTGVGPLEMVGAKEGSRTPTRVTPLEPERNGVRDSSVIPGVSKSGVGPSNKGLARPTGVRPQSPPAWVHEATANLLGLLAGVA